MNNLEPWGSLVIGIAGIISFYFFNKSKKEVSDAFRFSIWVGFIAGVIVFIVAIFQIIIEYF